MSENGWRLVELYNLVVGDTIFVNNGIHKFTWCSPYARDIDRNQIDHLPPVVRRVDKAIHRIYQHPLDKFWEYKLRYPSGSDLLAGWCYPPFEQLGPDD